MGQFMEVMNQSYARRRDLTGEHRKWLVIFLASRHKRTRQEQSDMLNNPDRYFGDKRKRGAK